jgi:hypothetical protein
VIKIRFRAWDKNKKCMTTDFIIKSDGCIFQPHYDNEPELKYDYVIMQFTGKQDKNGSDIYINDLLKDHQGRILFVAWSDMYASFCLKSKGWAFNHYFSEAVDASDTEIIGNVYQNPELWKYEL